MSSMTKRQRVLAALRGQEVDRPPISLWRHFFVDEATPQGLARAMLGFQRQFDWDFMKVNPRASYHVEDWGVKIQFSGDPLVGPKVMDCPVKTPADWARVGPLNVRRGVLGEHLEALRLIGEGLGGQAPYLMTVFTPLSIAGRLAPSPEAMIAYLREEPALVHMALEAITETFIGFVKECLAQGASGIFFATTDWATYDRLTDEEYARFGRPYDIRLLEAASGAEFNMLHVCRGRNMLPSLADYPVHAFNWDASDATNVGLSQGKALTGKAVVGGLDHKAVLPQGSPWEVVAQLREAWRQTGGLGWMVGPGCTFPPSTPEANLRAVREAVSLKATSW